MGRHKRPENAHLPGGVRKRGGRFYLTVRNDGRRTEVPCGSTLTGIDEMRRIYGEGPKQYAMPADFARYLWRRAKLNARAKAVEFTITVADVAELIAEANGVCCISGIRFEYTRAPGQRFRPWAPSIDRREPAKGYTRANLRIVCAYVNLAMNEFGDAVLIQVARGIASRLRADRRITETFPTAEIGQSAMLASTIAAHGVESGGE